MTTRKATRAEFDLGRRSDHRPSRIEADSEFLVQRRPEGIRANGLALIQCSFRGLTKSKYDAQCDRRA